MRAAGIRKAEQLGDLVERFARRVVARAAEQPVAAPRLDVEQQRVSAGDEQRRERRHGVAMLERRREEMSFHVMHADHRNAARERERLGEAHADEQRADEPRRVRHRDGVESLEPIVRVGERALDDRHDRREMRARRDLGDDAAEDAMHVLREDDERVERHVVARARRARPPTSRRTTSRCRGCASRAVQAHRCGERPRTERRHT